MILSYEEAIKEYGSDYKLKKAIDSGVVFKIENGIYSFIASSYDRIILSNPRHLQENMLSIFTVLQM